MTKIGLYGLKDMHAYSIRPEFYRYLEYPPHKKISETKRYLQNLIRISAQPTGHYWFIRLKSTGQIIGTFGMVNVDQRRQSAEIGYGIAPEFWGQGYFQEALSAVLGLLFRKKKFYRVAAKTRADNKPSISGLTKAGFKREGVLRGFYRSANGRRYDALLLGLLRGEFVKKSRVRK